MAPALSLPLKVLDQAEEFFLGHITAQPAWPYIIVSPLLFLIK